MKKTKAQLDAWKHNALIGSAAMDRVHMTNIINSSTASVEAKTEAFIILRQLEKLEELLRKGRAS